jgi:hypothetical protein
MALISVATAEEGEAMAVDMECAAAETGDFTVYPPVPPTISSPLTLPVTQADRHGRLNFGSARISPLFKRVRPH